MALADGYIKGVIAFQKSAFESSFDVIAMMQETAGRTIQASLVQMPWVPDDAKLMVERWLENLQEGRDNFKKAVCDGYDQMAENLGEQVSSATGFMSNNARVAESRKMMERARQEFMERARQGFEDIAGNTMKPFWNQPQRQESERREAQESREGRERPKSEQPSTRQRQIDPAK